MSSQPNWAKLVEQGRAKSYGVPWSDEEAKAIASGMSPEDVRKGVLKPAEARVEEPAPEVPSEVTSKNEATPEVETPKEEKPKAKRVRKPKK